MLARLLKDESGQGLVEYTLAAAGFAMILVFSLSVLGKSTGNQISSASAYLK